MEELLRTIFFDVWTNGLGGVEQRASVEAMTLVCAGFAILAVWGGLSRWHWFLRATILALAVLSLLFVRAYEPMLLFSVVVPATALTTAAVGNVFGAALANQAGANRGRSVVNRIGVRTTMLVSGIFGLLWVLVTFGHFLSWGFWKPLSWYECTIFAALVAGLAWVTIRLSRAAQPESFQQNHPPQSAPRGAGPLSFGLRDLFLSIVPFAIASVGLAAIPFRILILDWIGMLGAAACLVALTLASAATALARGRSMTPLAVLLLIIVLAAALHTWLLPDWASAQSVIWNYWAPDRYKWFLPAFLIFAAVVSAFTYLLLVAGVLSSKMAGSVERRLIGRTARWTLLLVFLAVYGPLFAVYYRMLGELPRPDPRPETNVYAGIVAAVNKLNELNPAGSTIDGIRELEGDLAKSQQVSAIYEDLFETLKQPAFVDFDWQRDRRPGHIARLARLRQNLRALQTSWYRQSIEEEKRGRFDCAAEYGLANIRLAGTQQSGGILYDTLLGIGIEYSGVQQISRVRHELSRNALGHTVEGLIEIDRGREPLRVTIARETAWADRSFTWRCRLAREASVVLAGLSPHDRRLVRPAALAALDAANRRDVMLRLLLTDLAVRLFQHDERQLPKSLSELCPGYLSAIPLDPFSLEQSQPLIYRRTNGNYVVYSVWKNGVDDGGSFVAFVGAWQDLDIGFRGP